MQPHLTILLILHITILTPFIKKLIPPGAFLVPTTILIATLTNQVANY